MTATATLENTESLVSALGLDDGFQPQEPSTLKDTGLSEALVEDLILKFLSGIGSESGRAIADNLCLPMAILEDRFVAMRQRQEIAPSGSAMLGDHVYRLTDVGRDRAHARTARVCLRRPGAGAAGRLRQLGARPNDCLRAAAKTATGEGVLRYSRRGGAAQPARPGDQRRQGHVHLRPAGQRQNDDRPADHPLLRPEHSHSARDRRRRQDHQDVRCLVPQGRPHRRPKACSAPRSSIAAGSASSGRPWSSAAS